MEIIIHAENNNKIAELRADKIIINNSQEALDIMGNLYYQEFNKIIIHKNNICNEFFDLKNGMAGEILQKFSNYRIKLAIVGNFSELTKKSIKDFIFESNKTGHVNFVSTIKEAIERLSKLDR